MKLQPAIVGTTILTIAAMFAPATSSSGVFGNRQGKVTYQKNGSEGTIGGKISFIGEPPQPKRIDGSADSQCEAGNELFTEDVIVKAGKLANTFVYVQSGDALDWYVFEAPATEVSLAHHGCQFGPRVIGMQIQQTLKIANEDATTHNTHFMPKNNADWNQSQPEGATPLMHKFAEPEVLIPVKCNQHPWEKAYVAVLSHPFFAVSSQNGAYEISGLPPGQYSLVAWHEKFGEQRAEVSIGVKEKKNLDFSFKGPGD
ncbi:MAG TPA: carboxypeptidase regulatory-like domain-containing protein [Pyrinomonadaceae bacterium]